MKEVSQKCFVFDLQSLVFEGSLAEQLQSVSQLVNQSVCQSVSQSVSQSNEPIRKSLGVPQEKVEEKEEDSFHGWLEGALRERKGMPMVCNWHARKPSSFNDGCGLCSPGRWPPARSNFQSGTAKEFLDPLSNLVKQFTHQYIGDTQRTFFALALGKMTQAPFSEQALQDLRERWFAMLPDLKRPDRFRKANPFFSGPWLKLHDWLEKRMRTSWTRERTIIAKEGWWAFSIRSRVPLVFRPKIKARQYDDSGFKALNDNYSSAKEHAEQIEVQFQEEEKMSLFPLSLKEARKRFRMRVASLGAIPKGDGRVRVIFDAAHFVQINNEIGAQDRLEFPGPEASAALMDVTLEAGHRLMIPVAADIALAHRRFKHREEDVGLLGCRVEEEGPIWFEGVGTFGVACAAYHFRQVGVTHGQVIGDAFAGAGPCFPTSLCRRPEDGGCRGSEV